MDRPDRRADHLKQNPAWYRALAYVKPSGANLHTPESRLPKRCDAACPVCNPEVWAGAGYTPQGIYDFYSRQFADIAAAFPGKSLSYMLIQAGFPRVKSATEYLGCPTAGCDADIPLPPEQTQEILAIGAANHGLDFVVQHNGLQKDPPATCHSTGVHPISGTLLDFVSAPDGCPNPWALDAGADGQVTTFQTNNIQKITTMAELDSALQNAELNSDAIMVEAYEYVLWQAIADGGPMDPAAAVPRTLSEWDEVFHERRRRNVFVGNGLPDPHPTSHAHTFTRTIGPMGNQIIHYVDPARCGDGTATYGVVRILP